jgi:multidrug efflux pump subunit AcrA (membrane-fusion protein)
MDLLKRRLSLVLGLLLIVAGIGTCRRLVASRSAPALRPDVAGARPVRTLPVHNGPVRVEIPITGRLRATDRMVITAEVSGTLLRTAKPFREGVAFRQGETLLRIDDGEVRAQLNAQQSALVRTLVQLVPDLRIDLPGAAAKWEAYLKSVPVDGPLPPLPAIATEQERNYLAGRGVLDQYYGIRSLYERQAKYLITAPFDGTVVASAVEPGTIVTPGMRLGEFIAPDALELETAVAAGELPFVRAGDPLRPADPADSGRWTGVVVRLGGNIDPATRTVKVFARITGPGLRDGQYLSGTIAGGVVDSAMAVPRAALLDDASLWTVTDSLLRRMPVRVVQAGPERAVVRGLTDGQRVVTDRLTGVHEGMRVAPTDP